MHTCMSRINKFLIYKVKKCRAKIAVVETVHGFFIIIESTCLEIDRFFSRSSNFR